MREVDVFEVQGGFDDPHDGLCRGEARVRAKAGRTVEVVDLAV